MSERDDAGTSGGVGEKPTPPPAPIEVPPFVAWMGRNGWLVLIPLILLELGFHGWAVWRARDRDQRKAVQTTSPSDHPAGVDNPTIMPHVMPVAGYHPSPRQPRDVDSITLNRVPSGIASSSESASAV